MKTISTICAGAFVGATMLSAAPLIPTDPGMTWKYRMTHQAGELFSFSNVAPEAADKIHADVAYRLDGTQKLDGKDVLKFEMHREGLISSTELLTVDDRAINCWERIGVNGEVTKLTPPQPIVAGPLEPGTTWEFAAKVAGDDVQQHYAVLDEEDVTVPAGKFHAFHIHAEQRSPNEMVIDRWFVQGVGIVKDVTSTRDRGGDLTSRVSLELLEQPKVAPRPELKAKVLTGNLSDDRTGSPMTRFDSKTTEIFVRWQGRGLAEGAKIRVVWIAENIGDVAEPNSTIDEETATATASNSHGAFTLSRPETGWVPGAYRVEFYLDDALSDTVKVKIDK